MVLPFNTTTINIYGPLDPEPFVSTDEDGPLLVDDVRAVFDIPAGSSELDAQRTESIATIYCDPVTIEIPENGYIVDNRTGVRWEINFSHFVDTEFPFDSLAHHSIRVKKVTGGR